MGSMNELQKYPHNPDSNATGYVDLLLCTNGTLKSTALVFEGVSEIIAMHIHRCDGGSTPQTRTADLCTGPPRGQLLRRQLPGLACRRRRISRDVCSLERQREFPHGGHARSCASRQYP